MVWRNFLGSGSRVRHTPESLQDLQAAQVADLRASASRYPADAQLRNLIKDLQTKSPEFAQLWDSGEVSAHHATWKT